MAREFKIIAAHVSDELTCKASSLLLKWYGAYSRFEGFGGYTPKAGGAVEEPNQTWVIATSESFLLTLSTVRSFARLYCEQGDQESIYFVDGDGYAYVVNAEGILEAIQ